MTNMARLERIVATLPEAERVDIAQWGDHPTFRVRGKNFVFCDAAAVHLSVKLPHHEADAVVATDPRVEPAGYGLGRHGWIAITLEQALHTDGWQQLEEWVRTSYTLVAPKKLAKMVLDAQQPVTRTETWPHAAYLGPSSTARYPPPCAGPAADVERRQAPGIRRIGQP